MFEDLLIRMLSQKTWQGSVSCPWGDSSVEEAAESPDETNQTLLHLYNLLQLRTILRYWYLSPSNRQSYIMAPQRYQRVR
jgi:hypothetical protein